MPSGKEFLALFGGLGKGYIEGRQTKYNRELLEEEKRKKEEKERLANFYLDEGMKHYSEGNFDLATRSFTKSEQMGGKGFATMGAMEKQMEMTKKLKFFQDLGVSEPQFEALPAHEQEATLESKGMGQTFPVSQEMIDIGYPNQPFSKIEDFQRALDDVREEKERRFQRSQKPKTEKTPKSEEQVLLEQKLKFIDDQLKTMATHNLDFSTEMKVLEKTKRAIESALIKLSKGGTFTEDEMRLLKLGQYKPKQRPKLEY